MRLTPDEVAAIKECAARHFGAGAVVRLFGSRVRNDLRGGDIDLHIVAETVGQASFERESQFRGDLEGHIGERRVDILVKAPGEPLTSFDRIALEHSVRL